MEVYIEKMRKRIEEKTGQPFDSIEFKTPGDADEYDVSFTRDNIALMSDRILTKKDVDKMLDKAINLKIK